MFFGTTNSFDAILKYFVMQKIWQRWKAFSTAVLDRQATLILSFLYWLLIAPTAIVYQLVSDPLHLKLCRKSFWFEEKSNDSSSLADLKKQY